MAILITGASGFLGSALIPKLLAKGDEVIALARDIDKGKSLLPKEVRVVQGDILEPNCGIEVEIPKIDKLYHLAAIHRLGNNQEKEIWRTNISGTLNVITFCEQNGIKHIVFVSSAYTQGRNPYERSKALGEYMVRRSDIPRVTIFKPSIIMGTPQHFYPGHFSQFVSLLIKVHQKAELIRQKIEGKLRLPVLEPVFRIQANPGGKLNLILIEDVADAIANIEDTGTFWLTHSNPPTIKQLLEWISEFIMVKIRIETDFEPTPLEAMFAKMSQAFVPYLWGDDFPSHLTEATPITKEFITTIIIKTLLG